MEGWHAQRDPGALVQSDWTGDKESMIDKHEESAREPRLRARR